MKAVLRSIKPYWLYLILIGKKTIEVGKDFPKAENWNKEVYLYCSKDMTSFKRIPEEDREWMRKYLGKVACKMHCDSIDSYCYDYCPHPEIGMDYDCGDSWWEIGEEDLEQACLSYKEFVIYAGYHKTLYGWHLDYGLKFPEPKELSEFEFSKDRYFSSYREKTKIIKGITRPPQTWCYVEPKGVFE